MAAKGGIVEGWKLFIGNTDDVPQEEDWVRINRVNSFGDIGLSSPVVDNTALEDMSASKLKGRVDHGDPEIDISELHGDPGQAALKAAAADRSQALVNFKLEATDAITPSTGDPTRITFKSLVLSYRRASMTQGGVRKIKSQLAVDTSAETPAD